MPTEALPFVNALQSSDEELAGASPEALNVTVDGAGAVFRRPGITPFFDLDYFGGQVTLQAASALHVTESGQVFAIVPRGPDSPTVQDVYTIARNGYQRIGSLPAITRPIVTETEMLLVIAAGMPLRKIELALPNAVPPLGGDPPSATHVTHNSLSLLANDRVIDRTKIRYSGIALGTTTYAGHEDWSIGEGSGGFFTAAASPDPVVALHDNTNEVWVFGSRTLQLFGPDTSRVFAPTATMEVGCSAPYSVVKREGEFYWLDHARRFVRSSGRGTEVLSRPIHGVLQSLSDVSDCFGYRVLLGSLDCVVWTFPGAGRTFVLQEGAGWAQWAGHSHVTNQAELLAITCHTYNRLTGENLVGCTGGEAIGVLRRGLAYDNGEDPIKAHVTTGFQNRDTDRRKQCNSVRLTFRRGRETSTRPEIRGHLTWRDSLGAWEPPVAIVLDGAQPVCELRSLGTYRRRQWRYTFGDSVEDLALAGAEEDFTVTD